MKKSVMFVAVASILLFAACSTTHHQMAAKETKIGVKVPNEAKSRDELVKAFGTSIGFGPVQRVEFSRFGLQIFVVWYDPYSGISVCYLHAYYYDPSKGKWMLFIDRFIEGASDLSADMTPFGTLVIRDSTGKVVLEQSVAKLPREEWYEKK
jgi:hypothetical protein